MDDYLQDVYPRPPYVRPGQQVTTNQIVGTVQFRTLSLQVYQTQNSCQLNMKVNAQNCTTSKGREVTCDVNRPIEPKETMEPRVHSIHTPDSQQWLMLSPQTKTG